MKRKALKLDDTNIDAMGGVSVDEAFARILLRQTPSTQQAIREEVAKTGRRLEDVLIDWMEAGKAA